ncbi:hypothetical protein MY3296_000101 [Beauveria thailandica]
MPIAAPAGIMEYRIRDCFVSSRTAEKYDFADHALHGRVPW